MVAERLDQNISIIAARVGRSQSGQISHKWSKEGSVVSQRQGHGRPRLLGASKDPKKQIL